jgi:hypothetical protein
MLVSEVNAMKRIFNWLVILAYSCSLPMSCDLSKNPTTAEPDDQRVLNEGGKEGVLQGTANPLSAMVTEEMWNYVGGEPGRVRTPDSALLQSIRGIEGLALIEEKYGTLDWNFSTLLNYEDIPGVVIPFTSPIETQLHFLLVLPQYIDLFSVIITIDMNPDTTAVEHTKTASIPLERSLTILSQGIEYNQQDLMGGLSRIRSNTFIDCMIRCLDYCWEGKDIAKLGLGCVKCLKSKTKLSCLTCLAAIIGSTYGSLVGCVLTCIPPSKTAERPTSEYNWDGVSRLSELTSQLILCLNPHPRIWMRSCLQVCAATIIVR